MKKTLILTASALAMTLTGLAAAQDAPQPRQGESARERGDMHHGGRHHRGGRGGRGGAHALMQLGAADANGDKQVTLAEMEALRAEEFAFRDRNEDGYLDLEDASPTHQRLAALRAEAGGDTEGRRGRGGPARLDQDEDGRISRAEFVNAPSRVFERLDANEDGVVTGEEIDARMQTRREGREDRRGARSERRAAAWWRD